MSKQQLKSWGWPAVAFLAAGMVALLAGPSLGAAVRLRSLQSVTGEALDFASCKDAGLSPSGASRVGQGPGTWQSSGAPIQYASGDSLLQFTEFEASGPKGWRHQRAQAGEYSTEALVGQGWKVTGLLQLVQVPGLIAVVNGTTSVRSFDSSTLVPRGFYKDTLTLNSGDFYTLVDIECNKWIFRGFNAVWTPTSLFGKLYQYSDAYGNATTPTYGVGGVTDGKVLQLDQFPTGDPNNGNRILYNYNLSGVAVGQLSSVVYQRVLSGVASTVRQVNYTYYLSSGSNGQAGQLQWADVTDGTNTIDKYYHRYDTVNANHPVRLILGPQAYGRAVAPVPQGGLGSDSAIDAATDTTLSTWADYKFSYGTGLTVSSETVQGAGCSCGTGGGTGSFSFTYTTNGSGGANGPNVWWKKTIETLPDGNQNIVYANSRGNTMLDIFKNVTSGQQWMTYHQYDASYREVLTAMPSSMISFNEGVDSLGVSLQNGSGLIYIYAFHSTTDLPNGAVAGYRSAFTVEKGSLGLPVNQINLMKYTSHSDGTNTVYPPSSLTQYRNGDGTGAIVTSFSYSFQSTTNQLLERVTTYPAVLTGQNGSGSGTSVKEQYDILGRLVWTMDEDGFINYTEYEPSTGAATKQIKDVNTSLVSNEPLTWVTPAGGGLHLVTQYEVDSLGRATKVIDPLGLVSYTVYKDSGHEIRQYPGWDSTNHVPTGPTRVSREDRAGSYGETLTMSAAPAFDGLGKPTGAEAVSSLQSLSRTYTDTGGRTSYSDSYFNFSGLTYSTDPNIGTLGTHFYRELVGYDVRGRKDRSVLRDGTITRTVFDSRGRASSTWLGTDDTPSSGDWSPTNTVGTNLNKLTETEYDSNGVGDGNVTRTKTYTSGSTSIDTVSQFDFRNRVTDSRSADNVATRSTYDNLDRVITSESYADADVNFVIGATELRRKNQTSYDERGQAYQTVSHNVDPVTGAIGNRLTSNTWYNARRMTIKSRNPNGLFSKTQYDGAGRVKASFVCYEETAGVDPETYLNAFDVAGDTVIEETVPTYDADSNVLYTTHYQRSSTAAVTGDLATSWSVSDSRRTFAAAWFDLGNRTITTADYGNNADAAFTRPGTPPAPNGSPSILVTKLEYDAGGRQNKTTNNLGKFNQSAFDGLSRVTKAVQNWNDGVSNAAELDQDKVTDTQYDSVGRMSQQIASNPTGAAVVLQTTKYVYGTTTLSGSPAIFRNDVLSAIVYPDSDDGVSPVGNGADGIYDRVEYTYDYAGRKSTIKDQRGVIHTMNYDAQGRLLSDAVTSPPPTGVDASILRIEYGFDDLSRTKTVTSFNATSGGSTVNQVKYTFDGWGGTTVYEQAHVGAVTGGTPSYQTTYVDGASGGEAKYVRVSSFTYPNARVVNVNYPGTIDDKLSRPAQLAHSTGSPVFADYTYLGSGSIVKIAHSQVTGGLDFNLGTGTGSPAGWDNFGRVIDHKWGSTADPNLFDRFQHTYDNVSRRLTIDRTYTSAPTNRDEQYTYDNLHRLKNMKRGTLSGGTIADASSTLQIDWNELDIMGNWRTWRWDLNGGVPAYSTQARKHNSANEIDVDNNDVNGAGASITQTGGSGMNWVDPTYDKSGNMDLAPRPGAETTAASKLTLVYDAWNRLVIAKTGNSGATTLAEYQYDGSHQRIVKLKPNGANWDRVDYYYNNGGQVLEERTATALANKTTVATVPKYQWVWDLRYQDAPILRDENKDGDGDCIDGTDQRLYYLHDANFNTVALVSTAGVVQERYAYNPYGAVSVFTTAWAVQAPTVFNNEILFAGYRQDAETQLYHVRRRAYHPTLGRFLQRDPVGYHDGMNLYEYVGSVPTMMTDPSGLLSFVTDSLGKTHLVAMGFDWIVPGDQVQLLKVHLFSWWRGNVWQNNRFGWGGQNGFVADCSSLGGPPGAGADDPVLMDVVLIDTLTLDRGLDATHAMNKTAADKWIAGTLGPKDATQEQIKRRRYVVADSKTSGDLAQWDAAISDLMGKVPNGSCIKNLDILSHQSPNQVGPYMADRSSGPELLTKWINRDYFCSDCNVFLSGCDSGLQGSPVAKSMANALKSKCSSVRGTKGLTRGGTGWLFANTWSMKKGSKYPDAEDQTDTQRSYNTFTADQ